jgi:hypothetical protein
MSPRQDPAHLHEAAPSPRPRRVFISLPARFIEPFEEFRR